MKKANEAWESFRKRKLNFEKNQKLSFTTLKNDCARMSFLCREDVKDNCRDMMRRK